MLNVVKWVLIGIGVWITVSFVLLGVWFLLKERGFRR